MRGSILLFLLMLYTMRFLFSSASTFNPDEKETAGWIVTAEIGSSFTVSIPKRFHLSDNEKMSYYEVSVKGDIGSSENVTVFPDERFFYDSHNVVTKKISFSQEKTLFSCGEIMSRKEPSFMGAKTKGSIKTEMLTDVGLDGFLYFYISLLNE